MATRAAGRNLLASCAGSPYLLQHANNPVHWYPWGQQAFDRAKAENKPIFLSIGYSACHWCHVMERESFENEDIAKLMNEYFVNIKVDKEERPDVDRVYMTYVQATTGSGGWPLSVFLTPDLKPFLGGTYFPPVDKFGQPAFPTVLERVHEAWVSDKDDISNKASRVMALLADKLGGVGSAPQGGTPPISTSSSKLKEVVDHAFRSFHKRYDAKYGGFGRAPKFPTPVELQCLFALHSSGMLDAASSKTCLDMALHTLTMMGQGGIHDHVGGGFARYSVDELWHVPHFEKMLYDNAQLMQSYLAAYQLSNNVYFADVARSIFDYVIGEMRHEGGGFYSAEDADSLPFAGATESREGAFYLWTRSEIMDALGSTNGSAFCFHYNVKDSGNTDMSPMSDPHNEFRNRNVLIELGNAPLARTASHFRMSESELRAVLRESCRKLCSIRKEKRPPPNKDDKIIASWNAMMISACARAHQVLTVGTTDDARQSKESSRDFLSAAVECAQFVKRHLIISSPDTAPKQATVTGMRRSVRFVKDEVVYGPSAGADDFANMIAAMIDLYEASAEPRWLQCALDLQSVLDEKFAESGHAAYYSTDPNDDPNVLLRLVERSDGAEPSPNSVSLANSARLALFADRGEPNKFLERAQSLACWAVSSFAETGHTSMPLMLANIVLFNAGSASIKIVITGNRHIPDHYSTIQEFLRAIHSKYLPLKVILHVTSEEARDYLKSINDSVESMYDSAEQGGKATCYICEGFTCRPPITELSDLVSQLEHMGASDNRKPVVKSRRVTGKPKPDNDG
ncbi:unnamed protein product (mitochondrion) [Plasmodiophora brassicae]|uniref:Spermatogenesis-associated protein 20-like TRX domain-containing protein n=1 Tax=Plasmodiophora brassicae TaxID=37360 RepID=A0A3P3Y9K5_PLABS|nr:unnamed protein product [Plasmodiophora brassicae]